MSFKINILLGVCFILISILLIVETSTNIDQTAYKNAFNRAEILLSISNKLKKYEIYTENYTEINSDNGSLVNEDSKPANIRCDFSASPNMYKVFRSNNGYKLKYASLAPLNKNNLANNLEASVIKQFSNKQNNTEAKGIITVKNLKLAYTARAVTYDKACLYCHMPQQPGPNKAKLSKEEEKGYYYMKLGMPAGAVIAYVPFETGKETISINKIKSIIKVMLPVIFVFVTLKILVFIYIEKPILILAKLSNRISRGEKLKMNVRRIGTDEIANAFMSLNRMRRCTNKLMKMVKFQK